MPSKFPLATHTESLASSAFPNQRMQKSNRLRLSSKLFRHKSSADRAKLKSFYSMPPGPDSTNPSLYTWHSVQTTVSRAAEANQIQSRWRKQWSSQHQCPRWFWPSSYWSGSTGRAQPPRLSPQDQAEKWSKRTRSSQSCQGRVCWKDRVGPSSSWASWPWQCSTSGRRRTREPTQRPPLQQSRPSHPSSPPETCRCTTSPQPPPPPLPSTPLTWEPSRWKTTHPPPPLHPSPRSARWPGSSWGPS